MMELTLAGGAGSNTLIGGPGDDHLIGGPDTDDVGGGKGEDVAQLAGGGADGFNVGDLRGTGAQLVDVSLAPLPILSGGDNQPDRVTVAGAGQMKLTGKVVVAGTATLTGLPATVNVSRATRSRSTPAPWTHPRSIPRRSGSI
jgi:Ca2+-binding RTX toxin-like protein